jgi:hypothetical protein
MHLVEHTVLAVPQQLDNVEEVIVTLLNLCLNDDGHYTHYEFLIMMHKE